MIRHSFETAFSKYHDPGIADIDKRLHLGSRLEKSTYYRTHFVVLPVFKKEYLFE